MNGNWGETCDLLEGLDDFKSFREILFIYVKRKRDDLGRNDYDGTISIRFPGVGEDKVAIHLTGSLAGVWEGRNLREASQNAIKAVEHWHRKKG